MQVRLAAAWTDAAGMPYSAGEIVDIDAVTLAELEELGVVEDPKTQEKTETGTPAGSKREPAPVIGPGPGAPEPTPGKEKIGPGPGSPEPTPGA